ncbi:MAG: response regulator [Burkholderiales bacterium]|nr:response regulator [Burkholderiales bacterium]MBI3727455.1 response regulator [Burkholderiales bacterium]
MYKILLLDDEQNVLLALQRSLKSVAREMEMTMELFNSPQEAINRLSHTAFDFIISDYHMPGMNGIQFLSIAKEMQPNAIRLMLSASAEFKTILGAINDAEVFRYIAKPWNQDELLETIQLAAARRQQIIEDQTLADELRLQRGVITPQEHELKRLEETEPGITKVKWGPDGSVLLD